MSTEFDYNQLDAITGGDLEFEREVLEEYLKSAPNDLVRLSHAVTTADAPSMSAAAHALKGSSATIGAKGFAAIALELEDAGKTNELGNTAGALHRLQAAYQELEVVIRERIAKAA